jgi:hypothetical protein
MDPGVHILPTSRDTGEMRVAFLNHPHSEAGWNIKECVLALPPPAARRFLGRSRVVAPLSPLCDVAGHRSEREELLEAAMRVAPQCFGWVTMRRPLTRTPLAPQAGWTGMREYHTAAARVHQ